MFLPLSLYFSLAHSLFLFHLPGRLSPSRPIYFLLASSCARSLPRHFRLFPLNVPIYRGGGGKDAAGLRICSRTPLRFSLESEEFVRARARVFSRVALGKCPDESSESAGPDIRIAPSNPRVEDDGEDLASISDLEKIRRVVEGPRVNLIKQHRVSPRNRARASTLG